MLGAERKDFRANDNGEPSGTAGKPILGQINSRELIHWRNWYVGMLPSIRILPPTGGICPHIHDPLLAKQVLSQLS